MKKFISFLLAGALALAFGCTKKEKAMDVEDEKVKLNVNEGYVTVDEGVELRYKTIGEGPEAVVVPAAIYMEYEFDKLADPSRTLIFYDQRGRGKSSPVSNFRTISMDSEIADLEAIRKHLGKEKISLIGWSYLGGMVFLYAAQFPEHVNSIVQVGPISPTYEIFVQSGSTPFDEESLAQLKKLQEDGLEKSDP